MMTFQLDQDAAAAAVDVSRTKPVTTVHHLTIAAQTWQCGRRLLSGQDYATEVWPNPNNMEGSRLHLTDLLNLTDPTDLLNQTDPTDQPDRLNQCIYLRVFSWEKTAVLLDFAIFRDINTFIRNQIILAIFPYHTRPDLPETWTVVLIWSHIILTTSFHRPFKSNLVLFDRFLDRYINSFSSL